MSSQVLIGSGSSASNGDPAKRRRRWAQRAMIRFTELLNAVREWVAAHDQVARVYITTENGVVYLRVVSKSIPHESELRRSLSAFIIAQTDRGFDVLGSIIPDGTPDELQAFLDPSQAFVLFRQ